MSIVEDADYFHTKAKQCFRLAAACSAPDVAFELRQMGFDFIREAVKLGIDPKTLPFDWLLPPMP